MASQGRAIMRRIVQRSVLPFAAAGTFLCLLCVSAFADTITWNGGTNTNWSTGANWSSGVAPNNAASDILILSSAYPLVNLDMAASIHDLTIGAADTLNILNTRSLSIYGTGINNAGVLTLNSSGTDTRLVINNTVSLTGGGRITLSDSDNNLIYTNAAGSVLDNVDNTISGAGQIYSNSGLTILNEAAGIIDASKATALKLMNFTGSYALINNGILRSSYTDAANGGLVLQNTTVDNTGNSNGGRITAIGANTHVDLNGGTILGGTLTTAGGGVIQTLSGGGTLNGTTAPVNITSGSTVQVNNSTVLNLVGAITNNGALNINSSGSNTSLLFNGNVTLAGTGSVTMSNNGQNYLYGTGAGVLTNSADHKIEGSGHLGNNSMLLVNQGTITADQAIELTIGLTGTMNDINGANTGTMQAISGGTLLISGSGINNAGGTIQALDGSTVTITASRINSGTLTTGGSGVIQLTGGSVINTVTNNGLINVANGQTGYLEGTISNNKDIQLNSTGSNTALRLSGDVTLAGSTGSVTMSDNGQNYLYGTGAEVLTNSAGHKIEGSGHLGYNLTSIQNAGMITANQATELTIDLTGTMNDINGANTGTMQAISGGTLLISGSGINNAGGTIQALDGSTVTITASRINSGTLTTGGSGVIQLTGGSVINTVTNNGLINVANSATGYLEGTITNNKDIQLNSTGSHTALLLSGDVTLAGSTGSVTMSDNSQNYLYGTGAGVLTNSAGHKIEGSGHLGNNSMLLVNQGTVTADQYNALTINLTGARDVLSGTNSGTLRANGGTLTIEETGITNSGTLEALNSSQLVLSNARINGGILRTDDTGIIQLQSSAIISNVINNGSINVANGQTSYLEGTITNNKDIQLNSTGSNTALRLSGDVTLAGTGSVTMSNNGQNYLYGTGAEVLTNSAGHTIQGSGQLGNNQMHLDNQGTITADQAIELTIGLTGTMNDINGANTGTMQAIKGGTLLISGSGFNNAGGTIQALEGSTVTITASRINSGTLTTGGSGVIQLTGGAVINTVTNNGLINVANGQTGYLEGTITNNKNIQLNSTGSHTALRLSGDVTLAGSTGSVTMSNNGQNYLYGTGAEVLTNSAGHTIQGSGQLGYNLTSIQNAGMILANQSNTLTIDTNSSGLTNTGTLQVNAASTMIVNDNLNNFSGTTLTGGTYNVYGTTTQAGTMRLPNGTNIVTNAATILLDGPNSNLYNGTTGTVSALANFASNAAAGRFTIQNGRDLTTKAAFDNQAGGIVTVGDSSTFNTTGNFNNSGELHLRGGIFNATAGLSNSGEANGYGTINPLITNTGMVRATGGTLVATAGISGPTGTVQSDSDGAITIGAASTAGMLINNGTLNLGTNDINVYSDYTNANFGVGNGFDKHANVSGSGQILATGDVGISLTGSGINEEGTILDLGNVHVNAATSGSFAINNTGTTGPVIRGAIQTAGNELGITDQNFGPIALGGSTTVNYAYTAASGGALSGQSFNVVTNFDNVSDKTVAINATAYYLAQGSATPTPVTIANQRVGGTGSQPLTVSNTAPAGLYTEDLHASFGANTADATNNGVPVDVLGDASSSAMSVGVSTATEGHKSGTVTLNYSSTGTVNGVSNGLGTTDRGSQTITVYGDVFKAASGNATTPVLIANQRIGGGNTTAIVVANSATGQAGYVEDLNAGVGGTGGQASASGSISGRLAGTNNTGTGSILASVDTSSEGAKTGTVTLNYQTAGTVNGVSNGLGTADANSQQVTVNGNVYKAAQGQLNTTSLNFGVIQVGQAVQQTLSITNIASGTAGFVEDLNASFGSTSGTGASQIYGIGSITGLTAGSTENSLMTVYVNTNTAGTINGAIGINYHTAGTVNNVSNGLGIALVGTDSFGVIGEIQTGGQIVDQAQPVINDNNQQPINLGNVRVNTASPTSTISVTNQATGNPQAALNATITGNGLVTASGSFSQLMPGDTNPDSGVGGPLQVGLITSTPGAINGTATIAFVSDATYLGGGQMPPTYQDVQVTGGVYQVAQPTSIPTSVDLGNVRLLSGFNQASTDITITNTQDPNALGYQEGLEVTVGSQTNATGTGPSNILAAGQSGTITLGMTAASAGVNNGSVALSLASNGAGTSELAALHLSDQTVNTTVTGYRLADPTVTPSVTVAARVGDVVTANQAVSIENTSPDIYTEGLKVSIAGASGNAQSNGGSIAYIGAQGTNSTAIMVGLASTATAGITTGTVGLNLYSTGEGTTGASDYALTSQEVTVNGKVYTAAVKEVENTTIDFGIVHRGDNVTAIALTVTNAAAATALNDVLTGSFGGASGPFTASGNLGGGIAAGDSDSSSLTAALDTSAAGNYSGTATASFQSYNPDMADLNFGGDTITMTAQVNNYANGVFSLASGSGSLTTGGVIGVYDLNFGSVLLNSGSETAILSLLNDVEGPADDLNGSFEYDALYYSFSGFDDFTELAAGDSLDGLTIAFDTSTLGSFSDSITLHATGSNASGSGFGTYDGTLSGIVLNIHGTVVSEQAPVPEPATLLLLGVGLVGLGAMSRKKMRK